MNISVGTNNEAFRQKWLAKTLTELPYGLKILDAGAGELANKKHCSHLTYVSQDFCQYDGQGDQRALQMGGWDTSKIDIVSDITDIPVSDEEFDVVLCSEVFEHLPDPVQALKELTRVLKPGGRLILTAPFCSLTHFAPFHFASGFNKYFYQHHLTDFGCEVTELAANGNYFEYLGQEVHRIQTVASNYTKTKLSFIERHIVRAVLRLLQRLSKDDQGSEELLCFGYQVVAVKK